MPGVAKLKILVTGGAGFIGSNMCDRLIRHGHRIICVDNLVTGTFSNIQPLMNHPNFRFIEHDVRDPAKIYGPVDRIYNLACPASPRHYQRDPIGTLRTCTLGAYNVLEFAREKEARVLQAVLEMPEAQRRNLAVAARQRVLQSHTAEHRAVQLERYYSEALAARAAKRKVDDGVEAVA